MKDNMTEGKGKMQYPNGFIYEGEWKIGLRHGKGKCIMSKDVNGKADIYEGDLIDGKAKGRGISVYRTGDKYN